MSEDDAVVRLRLADRDFRCVAQVPTLQVMKMSAAYASGDEGRAFGAMYDFLVYLIDPADWSAFEAHATAVNASFSDLDNAIGDALAEMAGRGKGSEGSSTPSSGGSPTPETPHTSRVVSLSQGTVEEKPFIFDEKRSSTA